MKKKMVREQLIQKQFWGVGRGWGIVRKFYLSSYVRRGTLNFLCYKKKRKVDFRVNFIAYQIDVGSCVIRDDALAALDYISSLLHPDEEGKGEREEEEDSEGYVSEEEGKLVVHQEKQKGQQLSKTDE